MNEIVKLYKSGLSFVEIGKKLNIDRNKVSLFVKKNSITRDKDKYKNLSGTKFHRVWTAMRQRCYLKTNINYHRYGGRGITVCERWRKFSNFYDDMYLSYSKHKQENSTTQIDRINNDGNYEPSNCKWSTIKEQAQNRLQQQPKIGSMQNTSFKIGGNHSTIWSRLKSGWNKECAFTVPLNRRDKHKKFCTKCKNT